MLSLSSRKKSVRDADAPQFVRAGAQLIGRMRIDDADQIA